MDPIDVHDLSEEEARLIAAFVAFLRQHRQEPAVREVATEERDWAAGTAQSFASDWDNPADAIYDNWREHYHVPER